MATSTALWRPGYFLVLLALLSASCETRFSIGQVPKPAQSLLAATADEPVEDPTSDEGETPPPSAEATHHQASSVILTAKEPQSSLKAFVIAPDGNIIALVQLSAPSEEDDDELETTAPPGGYQDKLARGKGPLKPACEVRTFSSDDEHRRIGAWRVGFMGQSLALGPDNCLYVAGSGRVGRYSLEGKELLVADSPQTLLIGKDQGALREAAEAEIETLKEARKQTIVTLQQQRDAIAARIEKLSDQGTKNQLRQLEAQMKLLDTQIEKRSVNQPVEQVMVSITERMKRVNAIAVSDKEVFITCPQTKGFGYAVWRTDLDFANPVCIVTGLSGCCGQMDVACNGGDLWVAENSRHRVVRYDREGKRLAAFGKRDRDGVGGYFGGCCNPMNLCFDKEGDILVSESNGQVKRFTEKGKFVEQCGTANVRPGCKNSAIRISPDGEVIYYIDVNNAKILVLMPNLKPETDDSQSS